MLALEFETYPHQEFAAQLGVVDSDCLYSETASTLGVGAVVLSRVS